jgi:hypothetical protein
VGLEETTRGYDESALPATLPHCATSGIDLTVTGRRGMSNGSKSGPSGICCMPSPATGQDIGRSSGGGVTPMARAPIAIAVTAVTVTATVQCVAGAYNAGDRG